MSPYRKIFYGGMIGLLLGTSTSNRKSVQPFWSY